jgi:hypothetical protein
MVDWRSWLGVSVSTGCITIGVAFSTPLLIPCSMLSLGCGIWVLRRTSGLPRKNELLTKQYREKWRQSLESHYSEKASALVNQLEEKEGSLIGYANSLQEKEQQLLDWQNGLIGTENRLSETLQKQHEYYDQYIKELCAHYNCEIQLRENSIMSLQQKLMGLANRPDPKQGFAAWVAQLLLQALQENEVFCQLKGFYKPPGIREVSVWVELAAGTTAKKLENISKEVGTMVKFGEPTIVWDADECVYEFQFSPQVESYETSYEVLIDNESELPEIQEPEDKNWFVNVVLDPKSNHYMIHGPTGGGKSVLVDNLMCVAGDDLAIATGKKLRIFIVDPKFPDSEWTYRGKRLKPQYRRWEGSIQGVLAMQQEVNDRLDEAALAAEAVPQHLYEDLNYTIQLPERDIDFWVIDEAAALHSTYKQQCEMAYKSVLWVGRSTLVKAILVGQNPNVSNYGLQIPDLGNCTRFYIGITALEALDRYIKPPREVKAKLKGQIYARLRRVKAQKMAGIKEPPEQFFALVVKSNEPPFVVQLPAPKAYAYSEVQTEVIMGEVEEEDIEVLVERAKLNSLSPDLRGIVDYATAKETWITASELRQNRNRFKAHASHEIQAWFVELERQGIGQYDGISRYRYPKPEE